MLLIIAGIVTSLAVFNGVYPSISQGSSSIRAATSKMSDRIESKITIIQVGDNSTGAEIWVKNIGLSDITNIEDTDIFFGPVGNFYRAAYGGPTAPYWEYEIEGSSAAWRQASTLKVTVQNGSALSTGTYMFKIVLPNGISDETTFGVE